MKQAKGSIQWIDDELVGFKCECGNALTVSIYKDTDYECKCGKNYILEQTNTVYERDILKD